MQGPGPRHKCICRSVADTNQPVCLPVWHGLQAACQRLQLIWIVHDDGLVDAQVGNQFVTQYYTVLHKQPHFLHRFYTDDSTMTYSEPGSTEALVFNSQKVGGGQRSHPASDNCRCARSQPPLLLPASAPSMRPQIVCFRRTLPFSPAENPREGHVAGLPRRGYGDLLGGLAVLPQ